ncbi:DNA repair exonuclease [Paenibacillus alvei]|uniref:DNA repair exonuclease n=1 Tax=Paenibacillus alvei TaxID=44250 RepID=A0ABT4E2P0_PAEAL|nr:DNA repair exonuclease [Paenibacillus alvei]MCY9528000.1 DNA repair exonuclease [Paenibacillus alvei]
MIPFRFLHAADLHVDSPFRGLQVLPDKLKGEVQESTFAAWDNLVRLAIRAKVDFVVISGDLYDGRDRSLKAQWRLQRGMEQLQDKQIPVYIIHGNHDPLHREVKWEWPSNVTVFPTDEPQAVIVPNKNASPVAVICGMSYADMAVYENLAAMYPSRPERNAVQARKGLSPDEECTVHADSVEESTHRSQQTVAANELFRIGLLHGTVDGSAEHDPYAPCSKRELVEKGYDYWALGHIHKREVLHESPYIVYPGNTQGRHVKETGAKGCYLVNVNELGDVNLQFETLDTVRWRQEQIDVSGISSLQSIMQLLDEKMAAWKGEEGERLTLIRVELTGRTPLYASLQQESFTEQWREAWQAQELDHASYEEVSGILWPIALRISCTPDIDIEQWEATDSFPGDLIRIASQAQQHDTAREALIQEALQTLLQQPRLRNWLASQSSETQEEWVREAMLLAVEWLQSGVKRP